MDINTHNVTTLLRSGKILKGICVETHDRE